MSEYKENTVGWWLSQLKEPLRSQSFEDCDKQFLNDLIDEIHDGMYQALQCVWLSTRVNKGFWRGTMIYWLSIIKRDIPFAPDWKDCRRDNCDDSAQEGWDMAKECAPDNWLKPKDGGEDKAIIDSPKKTTKLFFYGGKIKEPLVIYPSGEMDSVIVDEDKIEDLMNANPGVTFWPTNVGGVSPEKPESWVDAEIRKYREHLLNGGVEFADTERGKVKLVADSPAREIEAPERAVVGYEEPKPIDTIEKKHELRIKNLEAQVKDMAGEMENLIIQVRALNRQVFNTHLD